MEYRIISGDAHIDLTWLPANLFTENAPSRLKDRVPTVVETNQGKRWRAGDLDLGGVAWVGSSGREPIKGLEKRLARMIDTGLYEDGTKGIYRPTTPELRIKDQRLDGVDAEVLYGLFTVGARMYEDVELATFVYQIYNDWVADFCSQAPDHFAALACIPNHDPELAVAELYRAAKLGLRGADFGVSTATKPIFHKDWEPLWAAAAECSMPVSFHASGARTRQPDAADAQEYGRTAFAVALSVMHMAGGEYLASIILSGACQRHPDFKFVLGECGVSWIPHLLFRLDDRYEDQFQDLGLNMKPSEFWSKQGYSTYQDDDVVADILHLAGENNVIWSSDFPHPDGVWPDSLKVIEANLGKLEPAIRRKVICENAGKLYGFLK
ncbi:amidohydrolase [Dehalococcoidia bacterium]|nr:amidohydrolase [Dehalococcoidia bacterium]